MKHLLLLFTLALYSGASAYDQAVPFTSGYYSMCTKPEYLDQQYYDAKARERCKPLYMLNYDVIEYREDKVKISYNRNWSVWVYKSALVIEEE